MTEPARNAPLDLSPEEFRIAGHHLVDRLAEFLGSIRDRPLTPGESPRQVRALLDVNAINEEILSRLQAGGEAFVSNAVVDGRFLLRACVVNFRSTAADMREVARVVERIGAEVERDLERAA